MSRTFSGVPFKNEAESVIERESLSPDISQTTNDQKMNTPTARAAQHHARTNPGDRPDHQDKRDR
jgi:hypothetical protein